MSQFFNKINNKVNTNRAFDRSFFNSFLAMPFEPTFNHHMDIHSASSMGVYGMVEEYIRKDPRSVSSVNRRGWTPLMYAAQAGDVEVCQLLLIKGALLEFKNNEGKSSKELASDWGHSSVVNLLNQNN
ncbi:hypothetical protein ACQ4LE_008981 [Meloidogyne hapla]|uniref:ANK_REP_REGION domain-containing protein n=1 Tax=Meloidogyne hapla TaxID=6305 RepID=A0A1I8BJ59_MELHA